MNHLVARFLILSIVLPAFLGCNSKALVSASTADAAETESKPIAESTIRVGEALVGEGNEMAHVTVTLGPKDGPVGIAFANALARQSEGHTCQLLVLEPNLAVKPGTALVEMVTEKTTKQAVNFHGPVQTGVATAIVDCVREGIISKEDSESIVIVCCAFLHPSADDKSKIRDFNYEATKLAIQRANAGEPTIEKLISIRESGE